MGVHVLRETDARLTQPQRRKLARQAAAKRMITGAISRLPVSLWPTAGRVVRAVWPGYRRV
jgi:hypothetical protein